MRRGSASLGQTVFTLVRYAIVGSTAYVMYFGLIYLGTAIGLKAGVLGGWSFAAFALASTFAYFAHKQFTYRSDRSHREAVGRYIATIALGSTLAGLVSYMAASVFGADKVIYFQIAFALAWVGISAALMQLFVFASPQPPAGTEQSDESPKQYRKPVS